VVSTVLFVSAAYTGTQQKTNIKAVSKDMIFFIGGFPPQLLTNGFLLLLNLGQYEHNSLKKALE
jgi:hypothetical protein